VDASQAGGFDFLGYHFERGMKWARKKSMDKLKDTIRNKTRRTDGRSLKAICEDLNRTLRGWFGYFKHSKDNTFGSVDGYTRGRLRSILRKRTGKRGRGCGRDHQRWPNAGDRPVRFGGRGDLNRRPYPYHSYASTRG
jgi:RNA-directed DNA polymerase